MKILYNQLLGRIKGTALLSMQSTDPDGNTSPKAQSFSREHRYLRRAHRVQGGARTRIAVLLCVGFFLFTRASAQTPSIDARHFLNNVVDIGLSDFGFVTGEDSTHIYFIAIRRSLNEKNAYAEVIANSIKTAKFYNNSYRAKATKVSETKFGAFSAVLYQSPRPPESKWERTYFNTLAYKKGQLSTFRDKWVSDNIWAIHTAKIQVTKPPKLGLVTVSVPRDAAIAKGMPLINSDGFVAGLFAESSLGKTTVRVINMKEIADALYTAGKDCRYFSMIEWEQTDTRCVIEEKARIAALEKARLEAELKAKKAADQQAKGEKVDTTSKPAAKTSKRKEHFLDYGINGNYLSSPLQVNGFKRDDDTEIKLMNIGLSLYLNIDKTKKYRISLKPRYGNFNERNDPGLWMSPDNNVKVTRSSYQYVEMPIVFERRLLNARKFSMALGLGYSPAVLFEQHFVVQDKLGVISGKQAIPSASSLLHRAVAELYFYEFKLGRLACVYAQDFTSYPNADHVLQVGGTDFKPFADRKKAWYLGIEFQLRLRGSFLSSTK